MSFKVILHRSALLIVIGLLLYMGVSYGSEIKYSMFQIQYYWLGLLIPLQFLMISLSGFAFQLLSSPFSFNLKWTDWLGLSFIANFVNQILPYRPGLAIRYFYLNKHYAMPLKIYLWIMSAFFAITCVTATLFSILGWWYGRLYMIEIKNILILFTILFMFIILGITLKKSNPIEVSISNSIFKNNFLQFIGSLRRIMLHPNTFLFSSIVIPVSYLAICFMFYYIFISLQYQISFAHCMFITGIISMASIVPITAGNLGVNESLLGMLTQIMYQDFGIGFSAALIYRICQWIPSFIFGSLFSILLMGNVFPWKITTTKD